MYFIAGKITPSVVPNRECRDRTDENAALNRPSFSAIRGFGKNKVSAGLNKNLVVNPGECLDKPITPGASPLCAVAASDKNAVYAGHLAQVPVDTLDVGMRLYPGRLGCRPLVAGGKAGDDREARQASHAIIWQSRKIVGQAIRAIWIRLLHVKQPVALAARNVRPASGPMRQRADPSRSRLVGMLEILEGDCRMIQFNIRRKARQQFQRPDVIGVGAAIAVGREAFKPHQHVAEHDGVETPMRCRAGGGRRTAWIGADTSEDSIHQDILDQQAAEAVILYCIVANAADPSITDHIMAIAGRIAADGVGQLDAIPAAVEPPALGRDLSRCAVKQEASRVAVGTPPMRGQAHFPDHATALEALMRGGATVAERIGLPRQRANARVRLILRIGVRIAAVASPIPLTPSINCRKIGRDRRSILRIWVGRHRRRDDRTCAVVRRVMSSSNRRCQA